MAGIRPPGPWIPGQPRLAWTWFHPTLTPGRHPSTRMTGRDRPNMFERKCASALPSWKSEEELGSLSPGGLLLGGARYCGADAGPRSSGGRQRCTQGAGYHGTLGTMVRYPTPPPSTIPAGPAGLPTLLCSCSQFSIYRSVI